MVARASDSMSRIGGGCRRSSNQLQGVNKTIVFISGEIRGVRHRQISGTIRHNRNNDKVTSHFPVTLVDIPAYHIGSVDQGLLSLMRVISLKYDFHPYF